REETWVLRPRARGLSYGNLDEDARFRDRRPVLAHGRGDLGAGRPRPWATCANSILPATPRDLFAKRDLLRNGPFLWDSFTLDRIRNAVALYRSQGISRPLRASDMDEPHPDAVPDQRERVRPQKDKGIALKDRNFLSEDLPLPGWNPGFTPGDGSGTSEACLPDDFFANLLPGFTTPASLANADFSFLSEIAEMSGLMDGCAHAESMVPPIEGRIRELWEPIETHLESRCPGILTLISEGRRIRELWEPITVSEDTTEAGADAVDKGGEVDQPADSFGVSMSGNLDLDL
uniref:Uncharacterized protein n=1 Tax=Brassica oleracea var. oleracea TaxID=109376 RepID=A0A0D3BYU8_BRAOL